MQNLTTKGVANRLGLTPGAVRHHVPSTDRLYSLACARVLGRLELRAEATSWQDYLRCLSGRLDELFGRHPGVEHYLVHGPYEQATLDQFQVIIDELIARDPGLTPTTAHLLGSRVVTLTAWLSPRTGNHRYPPDAQPPPGLDREVFDWTLDALLVGAHTLLREGVYPRVTPTPEAEWARVHAQGT